MAVSTKPYIGTRDFFPEDTAFRNWMFGVQRDVCRRYSYEEYAAPIVEPLELYLAKSSEEIVSEQMYRFKDRGDREVAIRPELTPTLARMVASRAQSLPRPIRWFNIGNFMRYERPGRGRLREFYQLNVDLLGSAHAAADVEILMLALDVLRGYGAGPEHFEVRFSDRRLLGAAFPDRSEEALRSLSRLVDKRDKLKAEEFDDLLAAELKSPGERAELEALFSWSIDDLGGRSAELDPVAENLAFIQSQLTAHGYQDSVRFDPGIVRGFDYYTGFVFEIYDRDPENRRALFGGGRYDRLVGLFGKEDIPAVGFGMGDVTLENFIRAHDLVPKDLAQPEGVFVALMSDDLREDTLRVGLQLRAAGLPTELSLEATRKFGRQLEQAAKKNRRFVVILGESELAAGQVTVKDLVRGEQESVPGDGLIAYLKRAAGG